MRLTERRTERDGAGVNHPGWAWLGFALAAAFVATAAILNGASLFAVSGYDSYALQAQAWRSGMTHLPDNLPHLELAVFNGEYYVSFPPVPTLPIWALQWVMPDGAPSGLLTVVYLLLCYPVAYCIGRRHVSALASATLASLALVGGSFLDVGVSGGGFSGGVWYQAQALGLLLTLCAFHGVPGPGKARRFFGWLAIALAVGCRPFQGIYIPFLVWARRQADPPDDRDAVVWFAQDVLPYWIAPAMAAGAMGWYNWVRFGSPLEFGHNYLPEFTRAGQTQFALRHIPVNLFRILRPPFVDYPYDAPGAPFPLTLGFAVYFTQPMLADASTSLIRRDPDTGDRLLLGALVIHLALLLSHRTFGGWQYGARYICDMLPGLLVLRLRSRREPGLPERVFLLVLAGFNLAGTVAFHAYSGH
ncbi:MAG: hypothetical protein LBS11_09675 [Oscillospiraceae bacterium]|jgi:hypothetical protein|nr:hypothetical protein [Oscillospiraceae bacterium]